MKINEGKLDRIIRILVGIGILTLALWGPQSRWGYLGLIPLITGLVGFCPMYSLFGVSTCPRQT